MEVALPIMKNRTFIILLFEFFSSLLLYTLFVQQKLLGYIHNLIFPTTAAPPFRPALPMMMSQYILEYFQNIPYSEMFTLHIFTLSINNFPREMCL